MASHFFSKNRTPPAKTIAKTMEAEPDFLMAYLHSGPAFAALVRGVECRLLHRLKPFEEPLLDLGCGDGLFSSIALGRTIFAAIDNDWKAIAQSRAKGVHRHIAQACATRLPFKNASFRTVIANSVVEHISDVESVIKEVFRVLKTEGHFIISVPSHRFADMLLGSSILRTLGMFRWAVAYGAWFNRHSGHFHTDDAETWCRRLTRAGFKVEGWQYYLTPAGHRAFDLSHYLSVPRWISRTFTGKWVAVPSPITNRFLRQWLLPYYRNSKPQKEGPYLFIHTRKN